MADFVALVTPPILVGPNDVPAEGSIFAKTTSTVALPGKLVVPFQAEGKIVAGQFQDLKGGPYRLPVTPEGVAVEIVVQLFETKPGTPRSKFYISRTVAVPNQNTVTWDALVDVVPVESGADYDVPSWVTQLLTDAALAAAPAIAARDAAVTARNQAVAAAESVPTEAQLTATVATQVEAGVAPKLDKTEADVKFVPQSAAEDKAVALRPFWRALSNRGDAPCDVLFVGDSFVEGVGALSVKANMVSRFRDAIREMFPTAGVKGGYGSRAANGFWNPADQFVISSGGSVNANYGIGLRGWQKSGAGQFIEIPVAATGFDIVWTRNTSTGSFKYQVDGGAFTTINTVGALTPAQIEPIRGLSDGTHTLRIEWAAGGAVVIENVMIYNGDEAAGIRVWNGGKGSQQTSNFTTLSPNWFSSITMNPALVVIAIGVNNWAGAGYTPISSAATKTQLQALIAGIRAKCSTPPSFVLCVQFTKQGGGLTNAIEPWENYVAAINEVAAADASATVFDMRDRFGALPAIGDANTALVTDYVHPNNAGHRLWAESLARFVAPV